ncbi:insulin-induced gene 1 [Lynx pardinus]|uniref:Insulin-induced gene protein n=1 Tax=Lynx pardinus TaxID=191816 RepID=A0A485NHD6_LYNPA|nr:insulin-induced gene 1 [Lynx pardinus]
MTRTRTAGRCEASRGPAKRPSSGTGPVGPPRGHGDSSRPGRARPPSPRVPSTAGLGGLTGSRSSAPFVAAGRAIWAGPRALHAPLFTGRHPCSDIILTPTGVQSPPPPWASWGAILPAVVGLLYPCIDSHLGEPHKFKREWASVMRCVAVFVGINHASAKLDFANNVQLSLTLAALSLGLWWTFDRSRSGLGLGITIAFLATLITQLLVYNGVYQYTSPDFLYIRSWLPCIFFSGGVTVGNIGRQLAMGVPEKPHSD